VTPRLKSLYSFFVTVQSTQLSDWLWEKKQRQKQKFRYRNFRDIKRAIDYNDRQWFEEHGADKARMARPSDADGAANNEAYVRASYQNFLASGNLNGWPSPEAKREVSHDAPRIARRETLLPFPCHTFASTNFQHAN
jgi:hypothetical protein